VDSSNQGQGQGGPNGGEDASCSGDGECVDDESGGGNSSSGSDDGADSGNSGNSGNSGKGKGKKK
jgi:hypothetical protein